MDIINIFFLPYDLYLIITQNLKFCILSGTSKNIKDGLETMPKFINFEIYQYIKNNWPNDIFYKTKLIPEILLLIDILVNLMFYPSIYIKIKEGLYTNDTFSKIGKETLFVYSLLKPNNSPILFEINNIKQYENLIYDLYLKINKILLNISYVEYYNFISTILKYEGINDDE